MSDAPALVDAHHHVWDLDVRPQPWLDEPGHEPIRRNFDPHALRSAATPPGGGAGEWGEAVCGRGAEPGALTGPSSRG
ncbi:hypothetical protein ACFV2H_22840, partial [Streptomyces sp. NPDC059629]